VNGKYHSGGIIGKCSINVTITNCYNSGPVSDMYEAGGIVGYADQTKMSSNVHYESKVYVVPEIQKHRLDEIGYWLNGIAMANQGLFENRHNVMLEIGLDENSWQSYLWLANAQPDYSSGLSSTVRSEISSLATTTVPSPSHSWPKRLEQAAKVAEKELDKYYKPFYK
jgi:hypothetical protein